MKPAPCTKIPERWPLKRNESDGTTLRADAQDLAALIAQSAQMWATGISGGKQRFFVSFTDAKDLELCSYGFACAGDQHGSGPFTSESPNLAGVTSQLMRNQDRILDRALGGTDRLIEHLLSDISRKQARIDELEKRHLHAMGLVEEMSSLRDYRAMEQLRLEKSENRKDMVLEKLGILVPTLVKKLSGAQASAATDPQLAAFLKSITPEQLNSLSRTLRPEQLIVVLDLLRDFADDNAGKSDPEEPSTKSSKGEDAE